MTQSSSESWLARGGSVRVFAGLLFCAFAVTMALVCLAPVRAQTNSHVAAVDPESGKVNDQVTVTGESLGKGTVSAVYLSDDKNDYKAAIVDQQTGKIVFKVPQVKAGGYNVSIQIGGNLLIQPVKFNVTD